ncbi:hypothetical protein H7Y40_00005, partial [Pedobacter sp.]|nr:hypothetical protein [Candidatus Saccharibacteria bacterium]
EVVAILVKEEKIFRQTLRKGLSEFDKQQTKKRIIDVLEKVKNRGLLEGVQVYPDGSVQVGAYSVDVYRDGKFKIEFRPVLRGEDVFYFQDTHGFPKELLIEEAQARGIIIDPDWERYFNDCLTLQRINSQTAAKGTFKGGLGGQTEQHKKYHTATHLMYQALREVLGEHVVQRGSNITEERLRFDFSHPQKVTPEELQRVEAIVNEQIQKDLKISWQEYPTKVAIEEKGALGQFGDRYGDTVKVYTMIADGADKPFSFEVCGGPHVDHTHELIEGGKVFKIKKEEASSAGIRRIKAVLI